jgi:site-specific DNA-methyltransferase (adenine-specific)
LKDLLGSLDLNRIYQIDCIEGMKLLPDKSINLILTDLPYGVTARNKWDQIIPFEKLWEQYERIIKDDGAIVLHSQQPFTSQLIMSNPKLFKYTWIWSKSQVSGFLNAKRQPLREHEDICVFYKKQCTYNPQMTKGKMQLKNTGGSSSNYNEFEAQPHYSDEYYPKTILNFPLRRFKDGHPTQKPVELEEYLIRTYTNENEIILDSCMGSGTTAVAALKNNRKFVGFETESKYIELANKRIDSTYNEIDDQKLLSEYKIERR